MVYGQGRYYGRGRGFGGNRKRWHDSNEYQEQTGENDETSGDGYYFRPKYSRNERRTSRGGGRSHEEHNEQKSDTSIDNESFTYLEIVYERMHEPFEDDEEKELFVENVLEQLQGKETNILLSSLGSKTVQKMLELNTKKAVIEKLIVSLRTDMEVLSRSQFATLALQNLLINCLKYLSPDITDTNNTIEDFILGTAEFCIYNFPNILDHPYQNYILKTVVHILAGNTTFGFKRGQHDLQPVFVDVPASFAEMFRKLSRCILSSTDIEECLQMTIFSILVQNLLKTSKRYPEVCAEIVDTLLGIILNANVDAEHLHPVFTNNSSSYVVEALVEHLNRKQRKVFMKKYVLNHLEEIIEHKVANNVLKMIIKKTPKKEAFEKLFDKLEPHFKLIYNLEHDTLLVAIAECCVAFDVCQARFVIALKSVLQCSEGDKQDYFVLCVLHMLNYEQYVQADSENTATISLNGSLLVQKLLNFSKPIKIAMAIINTNLDTLKRITCDPKGCHVMDAFMKSQFVGEKSRDKLIAKLKDIAITLACSPYGSRCIDTIWAGATLKQKIMLADSLAKNIEVLSTNKFGKFVNKNLGLYHFKNRLEDWKRVQTSQDRKQRLFKDIVDNDEQVPTKRKKK